MNDQTTAQLRAELGIRLPYLPPLRKPKVRHDPYENSKLMTHRLETKRANAVRAVMYVLLSQMM